MNSNKPRKRLSLDVETLRVLKSDELAQVEGGAGDNAGAQARFSITISWGGNCNCCTANA